MPVKRMRVFAGPNGSGKTTIIKNLRAKINFGVYVNADDIEHTLRTTGNLSFTAFQLNVSQHTLQKFIKNSQFSPVKRNQPNLWQHIVVNSNKLTLTTHVDSYIAADMAEFIRQQALQNGLSLTYETVMSHSSKIDFFKVAKNRGYKVYLYFIATEDPSINQSRVALRVAQNGHAVNPSIVQSRYYRSLDNLKNAVMNSDRAYIFDNSGRLAVLIAEVTNGKHARIIDPKIVPSWVDKYLL